MPDRLRLSERIGLGDEERLAVYYTALLVNVGCHSDAHEQAKWFGDDIALKSGKYRHEQRSLAAAASALRLIGSGNPPLHRFQVGLEFTLGGFREVETMIAGPAALAAALARRLSLPMEHVRSEDPKLARTQDRLNWLNRLVVCCECNRPTLDSIKAAGFEVGHLEHGVLPKAPPFVRPMILGTARWPQAARADTPDLHRAVET